MLAVVGTSPGSQPTGWKADSATSATTTPSTRAESALSASKIGSCRAGAPPTASRSARPALRSRSTSTASAATSKQRDIADGSASAAPCATTSTGEKADLDAAFVAGDEPDLGDSSIQCVLPSLLQVFVRPRLSVAHVLDDALVGDQGSDEVEVGRNGWCQRGRGVDGPVVSADPQAPSCGRLRCHRC